MTFQTLKTDPLLMESPYSSATRPLVDEPLTPEDWHEVYSAHRAFIARFAWSSSRLAYAARTISGARNDAHD